ncbi:MAG: hypothetical protein ACOC93_04640 [Planctomycetota bacterium]
MQVARYLLLCSVLSLLSAGCQHAAANPEAEALPASRGSIPVGGANSPEPSPPPDLAIDTAVLDAGDFSIRVPTGTYQAPEGGAPNYSVPGPIVAFQGDDGVWRGHGYLETYPRLLGFEGRLDSEEGTAELRYSFEDGQSYHVTLQTSDGAVLLDETSDLGPRNLYVFDAYYDWQPGSGFALDQTGENHAFVYLPCYYDKPEITINPAAAMAAAEADPNAPKSYPGAAAVTSDRLDTRDVAGFWCRDAASWAGGDTMGIQLWQHRQLPGDPASRHFLGPETKSDSTPNPRTAGMLGQSLYEGHVTIELNLGTGSRKLGFAACGKGDGEQLPEPFQAVVQDHLK